MKNSLIAILTLVCLAGAFGCGQSATNEPQKLEKIVEESPAEPLPKAETAATPDSPKPAEQPVEQAAFQDEAGADVSAATVPTVELSKQHAALSRVKVGDSLPDVELPKVLGGTAKLSALYGKSATVVVFWKGDRQMALDLLADLGPDVVQKFGSRGVEVVGVAVNEEAADARSTVQKTDANFPQLLDADGKAFEKVGAEKLPWMFVLDANGKIVYFDLEYSLATRRELQQALLATVR
jgi:peroxiredoxin